MGMENDHSIFPPSSGHIWGAAGGCTAWVGMAQQYPEPDEPDKDKDEGTASHEVGEHRILEGLKWPNRSAELVEDGVASNGTIINEEMVECAEIYSNDVLQTLRNMKDAKLVKIGVEDKGLIARIHSECFGTKDCWIYDTVTNTLYIWDYKFGHRFVEVFETLQGVPYAVGLKDQIGIPLDATVVFRIVQPRAYSSEGPIREWRVTMMDILPLVAIMKTKAEKSLSEFAEFQTGSHCRDCYPRFNCPAALQAGMGLYEVAMSPTPHILSKGALGLQLTLIDRALEQLKSLKVAFDGQVEATVRKGQSVPGWGLEETVGREAWIKPVSEVLALGDMYALPISKPGVITPNQARKIGIPKEMTDIYAGRSKKGLKLVKDNSLKVRKAFSYNESTLNKGA